jgi:tyrosine-protein kinase Etk/Wzc
VSEQDHHEDREARERDTISLLDLVAVLVRRRWLIVGTTLVAAALVVVFSVLTLALPPDSRWNLMPNVYSSQVKIMLRQNGGSTSISGLGDTGSTLSLLLGGQTTKDTNVVLAEELLKGNALRDAVTEELDFRTRYHLDQAEFPKTAARTRFGESLKVESASDESSNILLLAYEDTDPKFAFQVVGRTAELLEQRFRDLTLEQVRAKKAFVEDRLRAVESELFAAQKALTDFQIQHGIADVSAQLQQQSNLVASLKSEIVKDQLELEGLRRYLPADDPRLVKLQQDIQNRNDFVDELSSGDQQLSGTYIPPSVVPSLLTGYLNLQGELDVQKAVYRTLRQQYEQVKIEEADNSKTFQVIEQAEVPEVKAGPSRSKICVLVTVAAFVLAIFAAFVKEYLARSRQDPVESEKLARIGRMLHRRRKQ